MRVGHKITEGSGSNGESVGSDQEMTRNVIRKAKFEVTRYEKCNEICNEGHASWKTSYPRFMAICPI